MVQLGDNTQKLRSRTPKTVVAWCRDCQMGSQHTCEIGSPCWGLDCVRTLIKRVGYICHEPKEHYHPWQSPYQPNRSVYTLPCEMIHWTVKSMKECKHDAY